MLTLLCPDCFLQATIKDFSLHFSLGIGLVLYQFGSRRRKAFFLPNHRINNFFDPSHFYFLCATVVWREALDCERVKECPSLDREGVIVKRRECSAAPLSLVGSSVGIFSTFSIAAHCIVAPISILKGEIKTN